MTAPEDFAPPPMDNKDGLCEERLALAPELIFGCEPDIFTIVPLLFCFVY